MTPSAMTRLTATSRARGFVTLALLSMGCAAAAACNAPRQPAISAQDTGQSVPRETGEERVQRLEREARALARADGCTSGGECRAAPVGDRPCGGPRTYPVYCARTTDSVALYRKLEELAGAERAHNQEQGLASTCEFRMPPRLVAGLGSCRAAAP
jgi:hypothetical protein